MIHSNFKIIKKSYDEYINNLLKKGIFPVKDTGVGYWGATPATELFELFKNISLHHKRSFIDLGAGDGRAVLIASLFDVKSHGIEIDEELVDVAMQHRRNLSIPHFKNTKFLQKNFHEHDLSEYEIIYISPDKPFFRDHLETKLEKELKGKLIVHGYEFLPRNLKKEEEHTINGERFTIFKK